jgi:hypothetical protein
MDTRPSRVYGVLVRDGRVFVTREGDSFALPGGVFRPLAEDRKFELRAHLQEQLGIDPTRTWAQGAFDYHHPRDERPEFSGFYTVWDWEGEVPEGRGAWLDKLDVSLSRTLPQSLRILLFSILDTVAMKTR